MTEWLETIATRGEVLSICAFLLAMQFAVLEIRETYREREREKERNK